MKKGKELRTKALSTSPRFNYLPDSDRYLVARTEASYKFNLIGAGIIGQEHTNITHLEGRATIHGVYDPNPRSIATVQAIHGKWSDTELVIYDSLEAACNDPEVDALIICTPNYTHIDVVKVAAQSGKHILLEKPIATTVADALEITQIAEGYEAVFQVGLQYRYKSISVEAIHEVFDRKTLGEVKLISMQEHRIPFLDKVNQWNKFAKYSGDTLIEKCCHYFDLLNLFAQAKPKRVFASGSMAVNFTEFEYNGEKSDILDNAFVVIDYENGVRANFSLCMFAPLFYEELIICGDAGRLRAWEQSDYLPGGQLTSQLEIMVGEDRPSRRIEPAYPTWIEDSGHNGATYYEHVYFVDNIEGKETTTASAREGLWSVIVAAAAQESIKQGRAIDIDTFLSDLNITL
ncbi:MAG: Gfo/Idh/MocA family oxidoreductase [Phototrophicaceae bacterium]